VKPENPQSSPRPWLAVLLTLLIAGIAIHQQATNGNVSGEVIVAICGLVGFWSGRSFEGPEKLLDRWRQR
jgi:amino acid permease